MQWINEIKEYIPYNQQEEIDKRNILNYISIFKDSLLLRKNEIAHFTVSSFIVNKQYNKTLMIHHVLRNTWSWTGGHLEENETFIMATIRELEEEIGIKNYTLYSDTIFSLDILPMEGHYKNGTYLSSHLHLSIAYLIIIDENQILRINKEEANHIAWLDFSKINESMFNAIDTRLYQKLINKIKTLNQTKE